MIEAELTWTKSGKLRRDPGFQTNGGEHRILSIHFTAVKNFD